MGFNEKGEIIRTERSKPLTPEEEIEVNKLNEEALKLQERQEAEPDRPISTPEEEKENARKRLLVRQNLMRDSSEKK